MVRAAGRAQFELERGRLGGSPGSITLHDHGEVWIESRLMKRPLMVAVADIAAVVALDGDGVEVPEPERLPRVLHLPSGLRAPNVHIVFRRPVRSEGFRLGADRALAISPRERREGLLLDGISATVRSPEDLVATLRLAGVPWVPSLATAHATAFGVAPPELVAQRAVERARARRRARRVGALWALLLGAAAALALAGAVDPEVPSMLRIVGAGVAASVVIGTSLAWVLGSWFGEVRSPLGRLGAVVVAGGLYAVVPLNRMMLEGVAGPLLVVCLGAMAGLAGGILLALVLVTTGPPGQPRLEEPAGPILEPSLGAHRSAWGRVLAVGVGLAMLLGAAVGEPGSTHDLRRARAAVQVDDQLPDGWQVCCDGTLTLRGSALSQHLCAAEPGLPRFDAAARRSFNLPTPRDDRFIDGHLEVTVRVAPSAEDAAREMAALDAVGYLECTADLAERLSWTWQSRATGDAEATYQGRRHLSQVEGVVDTFRVRVPVGQAFDPSLVHLVRMRTGRSIVRVPVLVLTLDPPGLVDVDAIIESVLAQVRTAGLSDG